MATLPTHPLGRTDPIPIFSCPISRLIGSNPPITPMVVLVVQLVLLVHVQA